MFKDIFGASLFDFFKDQGSSLGAVATFLAVIVALGIGSRQIKAAKAVGDKQVNAVWTQVQQAEQTNREDRQRRRLDLLHALGIEANRIKVLAEDRLQVATPRITLSASLSREERGEAFMIYTTTVMRDSAGISELPGSLLTPIFKLLASVDRLNSIIQVKSKFGQLEWNELIAHLETISDRSNEVIEQLALTENAIRRNPDQIGA